MTGLLPLGDDLARQLLDELSLGIILCNEAIDQVLLANREGRRMLQSLDPRGETLPAPLRKAIERACASPPTPHAFTPAVLLASAAGRLFVRCKPVVGRGLLVTMTIEVLREADLFQRVRERHGISWREFQIVSLVRGGHGNDEIARRLEITVGTVKQYLNKVFKAFDVHSRSALVAAVERIADDERLAASDGSRANR